MTWKEWYKRQRGDIRAEGPSRRPCVTIGDTKIQVHVEGKLRGCTCWIHKKFLRNWRRDRLGHSDGSLYFAGGHPHLTQYCIGGYGARRNPK